MPFPARRDFVSSVLPRSSPVKSGGGAKISEILVSAGVPEDDVLNEIRRRILPWHGRLLGTVLPAVVVDPNSSVHLLISDIAYATSAADIDEAFSHYRSVSRRGRRRILRILGTVPSRARTLEFFRDLNTPARRA